ncbi:hypothetical protein LCGC14_0622880, partial [marine sediment metagenome]
YYSPSFVEGLTNEEIEGVLCHEVMHIVLEHLIKMNESEIPELMNVAMDMCINDLLLENDFELPSCDGGALIPRCHSCEFMNITIDKINEKTAIQIYHELLKQIPKTKKPTYKGGFDKHIFDEKGKETNEAIAEAKDKWKDVLGEASAFARTKGNIPKGLELMIDDLLNEKVDWKTMLYKYITRTLPFDYTYCLEKGTLIDTPRGKIPIEKLKQGRKVIGYKDGKAVYSTIKSKWTTKVTEKYTFETFSGKKIICSPRHRLLTERGYIQAQNITKSDKLICVK